MLFRMHIQMKLDKESDTYKNGIEEEKSAHPNTLQEQNGTSKDTEMKKVMKKNKVHTDTELRALQRFQGTNPS